MRPCFKNPSKRPNRSRCKAETKPVSFSEGSAERVPALPACNWRHTVLGDTHDAFGFADSSYTCYATPCSVQDSAHSHTESGWKPVLLTLRCCGCTSKIHLFTLRHPASRLVAPSTSCWPRVASEGLSQRTRAVLCELVCVSR